MSKNADAGERQIRPFAALLTDQRRGALHAELSEQFADLIRSCVETGKKGSLTLTVNVAPNKDGQTLTISDDLKIKSPSPDRGAGVFWADEHGNVSTRNPLQPELPLRDVSAPAEPDLKPTGTEG